MNDFDSEMEDWEKRMVEMRKARMLDEDKSTGRILEDFEFPEKFIDDAHEEYGDLWVALRTLVMKYQSLKNTLDEVEYWIQERPF